MHPIFFLSEGFPHQEIVHRFNIFEIENLLYSVALSGAPLQSVPVLYFFHKLFFYQDLSIM